MAKESTHDVTVLVFKDNYAARSFQVPLKWISKMGFFLWLGFAITVLSIFFGVKYYRIARRVDLSRVQGLENELLDLQASYHALETRSLEPKLGVPTATGDASATATQDGSIPVPVPTVTVTVAASTAPVPTVTVTASPQKSTESSS
ncbi:MAG: hypothetical protein AABZ55_01345, partial [Bdellovibrionota bacterium]